jgi:hypothetical protein
MAYGDDSGDELRRLVDTVAARDADLGEARARLATEAKKAVLANARAEALEEELLGLQHQLRRMKAEAAAIAADVAGCSAHLGAAADENAALRAQIAANRPGVVDTVAEDVDFAYLGIAVAAGDDGASPRIAGMCGPALVSGLRVGDAVEQARVVKHHELRTVADVMAMTDELAVGATVSLRVARPAASEAWDRAAAPDRRVFDVVAEAVPSSRTN